jgi:hypothetical protein
MSPMSKNVFRKEQGKATARAVKGAKVIRWEARM